MNFIENESPQKLRGGFYTAPDIADFLVQWAVGPRAARVLEPSCGDGSFLDSLNRIATRSDVVAWELEEAEAAKARERTPPSRRRSVEVRTGDFLEWFVGNGEEARPFDAVLGNPPFIRYQYLGERQQSVAEQVFAGLELPFTRHTNAWVPFVVACLRLLRPAGRLAMVVPSELLHIRHAAGLRQFLVGHCARVLILDTEELWFGDAQQGTVLLLAEKKSSPVEPHAGVAICPLRSRKELREPVERLFPRLEFVRAAARGKWTPLLLSSGERSLLESVRADGGFQRLGSLADVDVGIVTGANKFFLVPDAVVEKFELQPWAHPMFGRSEHVRGLIYDHADHEANRCAGLPANFLWFDAVDLGRFPEPVRDYLRSGEDSGLAKRYKCRVREPWFRVPSVYAAPVAMLKRAHHFPRLILNRSGAFTTDTAYRIQPTNVGAESLVYGFLNSLTALCAELEGRHYGGGVLELVPSEIEELLVPVLTASARELEAADGRFRSSPRPEALLLEQDRDILRPAGLSGSDCAVIHGAWNKLRRRRQRASQDQAIVDP